MLCQLKKKKSVYYVNGSRFEFFYQDKEQYYWSNKNHQVFTWNLHVLAIIAKMIYTTHL